GIHENIMPDMFVFSPWSRKEKVLEYLFTDIKSYSKFTGRPSWSGGASNLGKRIIYIPETNDAPAVITHELAHIYFESFFDIQNPSPLWLSEGVAVYMQVEKNLAAPPWLAENYKLLKAGSGYKLKDLIAINDLRPLKEEYVRLWYTQAYSLVRFLMKLRGDDSFYLFCRCIKEGRLVNQCLFSAYGMPFNRIAALEYAWRYDLQTDNLTELSE
ncbi:MAG: hypothetical protein NTW04_00765, partial [Elusimicrobia bacterium]|nr:hypothetical protein [Elusimicrobiota bacterium]